MKYYVVGIYDSSSHSNKPLYLYEVEAEDELEAQELAFYKSPIHEEQEMTFDYFLKKIGKRFVLNLIEI